MYSRIKYIIVAAVLSAALIISGCCGFAAPTVQPSPSPVATPTPAPTATPLPSVTPVPGDKPYDIGNRLSFVYTVSQYDGAIKSSETTDLYDYQKVTLANGMPGYRIEYISSKKGSSISIMVRTFYDASGMPVNGSWKRMDNGAEIEKLIMSADAVTGQDFLNFVVKNADKASGYENLSVIAGMYDCARFVSANGGTTIWLAEDVPVPVKVENANDNKKAVYELISWSKQ